MESLFKTKSQQEIKISFLEKYPKTGHTLYKASVDLNTLNIKYKFLNHYGNIEIIINIFPFKISYDGHYWRLTPSRNTDLLYLNKFVCLSWFTIFEKIKDFNEQINKNKISKRFFEG